MIPGRIERRARWVLDTIGATSVRLGDELPYAEAAWEQVDRGERPDDELARAFYDLARVEELAAEPDAHGRFRASMTALAPVDPSLERLRATLGLTAPTWAGARFAVALTHDVDVPWRWTRIGVRGAGARLKASVRAGRPTEAAREGKALAAVPVHRLRGTDPNWSFDRVLDLERGRGARSTFFVMAGNHHRADGPSPETYERLRPRLVSTIQRRGGEIGLHGSYTAADEEPTLAAEKARLETLAGRVAGQRYHYLRVRPHENLAALERVGFAYDSSVGFPDAPGFRAGSAQPYRPWSFEHERPLDLVEIPLALMDASFEERYLDLRARQAEWHVMSLLDWAAEHGGAFAVLWHTDRFDRWSSAGWDRLYARLIEAVHDHGGVCVSAGELAQEAAKRL